MRYGEGVALGSGLASAIGALVKGQATQDKAYEGQLNGLVKRDNLKSGIAKNMADASYTNYKTDREQSYFTDENLRKVRGELANDPVMGILLSTKGDGSNNNVGKFSDMLHKVQDTQYQTDARNYMADGNMPAANALNILRQPGATSDQFFSNGTVGNKVTGDVNTSLAIKMQAAAEAAKARYHTGANDKPPRLSHSTLKDMLGVPTGRIDQITGLPEFAIEPRTLDELVALSHKTGLPFDSQENVFAYQQLKNQQQPQQPQQQQSGQLTPEDVNALNGFLK